jgi:hypothetical protein
MCKFFSLISDGQGKIFYFDKNVRKSILHGELKGKLETDSHASLCDYFYEKNFRVKPTEMQVGNTFNWYEYNPITKELELDKANLADDQEKVRELCLSLNFQRIAPELVIKPIIHPLKDIQRNYDGVSFREIELLKAFISVWYSVRDSVMDSVGYSVRHSVGYSVRDSVIDSVIDSVGYSVMDSVIDSVGYSVIDSVIDSVGAYVSSFFNLKKWMYIEHVEGMNPFQSCIDLWEVGLVPSFDGKTWRLHAHEDAKIVFELNNNID